MNKTTNDTFLETDFRGRGNRLLVPEIAKRQEKSYFSSLSDNTLSTSPTTNVRYCSQGAILDMLHRTRISWAFNCKVSISQMLTMHLGDMPVNKISFLALYEGRIRQLCAQIQSTSPLSGSWPLVLSPNTSRSSNLTASVPVPASEKCTLTYEFCGAHRRHLIMNHVSVSSLK